MHIQNGISIGSAVFAYTLQWATTSPSKFPLQIRWSGPNLIRLLRPTWVHNPNGNLIGLTVFAGLTIVTDGQTDRQTDRPRCSVSCCCCRMLHVRCDVSHLTADSSAPSVTIGCILRSTAMWPNDSNKPLQVLNHNPKKQTEQFKQSAANGGAGIHHKTRKVGQCPTCWPPCRIQVVPSMFNAAVWLCSNAAKTWNPLKFAGVPQTNGTISAASGP